MDLKAAKYLSQLLLSTQRLVPYRHPLCSVVDILLSQYYLDQAIMSGYGKYSSQGHDNYFIGQQLNISGTYDNVEPHELGYAESAAYSFSQQPFSTYSTQLGSFAQPSCLSQNPPDSGASYAPRQYLSPISPQNQIFSQGLPHKYSDYASQTHYLHSPRYLPLRSPLPRDEVESQESFDESTMLSEPVIPPLQGFPDVREFDRLMARYVVHFPSNEQTDTLLIKFSVMSMIFL